jgi:hypothetical protein
MAVREFGNEPHALSSPFPEKVPEAAIQDIAKTSGAVAQNDTASTLVTAAFALNQAKALNA